MQLNTDWRDSVVRNRTKVYVYPLNGKTGHSRSTTQTPKFSSSNEFLVILPGGNSIRTAERPEDITQYENGLYQWSVTLKARMWPSTEVDTITSLFGLSYSTCWAILLGCFIVVLLCAWFFLFYCWISPRNRKQIIASTRSAIGQNSSALSILNSNETLAQQENELPFNSCTSPSACQHQLVPNCQHLPSSLSYGSTATSFEDVSLRDESEICHSMWVMNPVYSSSRVLCGFETDYKTQSLPNWVKKKQKMSKDHPICHVNVINAAKGYRNHRSRMRNDGAAIIALSRSKSQHLAAISLEREGVVIYDERTAL